MELKGTCNRCGKVFVWDSQTFARLGMNTIPRHCPRCNDERQLRPDWAVVESRECIRQWDGVVWTPELSERDVEIRRGENPKDRPAGRLTCKGRFPHVGAWHGVRWTGRVVFWFLGFPEDHIPKSGNVVRIRKMQVKHRAGKPVFDKEGNPIVDENGNQKVLSQDYTYYVVEPSDEEPTMRFVAVASWHKTTLKGLGRQIEKKLVFSGDFSGDKLETMSNRCNSGRFGCHTELWIVHSGKIEVNDEISS